MPQPHYCKSAFKRLITWDELAPSLMLLLHLHGLSLAHSPCTDLHAMTTAPPRGHSSFHLCHSSAKLHVSPVSSPAATLLPALRAGLQGLPEGPGFYLGTGTARGQAVEQHVASPTRRGTPGLEGLFSIKTAAMPESSKPFFQLFFFPLFPSLWFFFSSNYSRELLFL